ncbi:MAG: GSCFA domain-containing protein [Bacteroidia bacterium]|nr:GSCFA domain-containing protein [Bacteroidia bacterium]
MADFRTTVDVPASNWQMTVGDTVFSMGSCFSDEISSRLEQRQVECCTNPYGVVYNPMSLERQVERIVGRVMDYPSVEIVERDGMCHSLMAHSVMSGATKGEVEDNLRHWTAKAYDKMKSAKIVVLTFGTAWVYKYMRFVVANCHKMPSSEFDRVLMNTSEVSLSVRNTIRMIRQVNEEALIVLTVSPIRHLKDTAHGNAISKSTLLLGVEDAIKRTSDNKVGYFPSYEIILDDLRDYRFYAADMVHPSDVAVDYVFDKFMDTYFTDRLKQYAKEGKSLWQLMNHRPMGTEIEKEKHYQLVQNKREEYNKRWGVSI